MEGGGQAEEGEVVLVGCGEGPCENGVQVCDSGHGGGAEGECGWRVVV